MAGEWANGASDDNIFCNAVPFIVYTCLYALIIFLTYILHRQSLEKVLVQNILFGLSPSLTDAIKSIPRWRFIQAAVPHVMHCAASLLYNR